MIKISIQSLKEISKHRPPGYFDEVVALGKVESGVLYLDPKVYHELRIKYTPKPSLTKQAGNAVGALGRIASAALTGNKIQVAPEEVKRRLEICYGCEFLEKGRCLKCGCWIKLKNRLETEHCPIGKW